MPVKRIIPHILVVVIMMFLHSACETRKDPVKIGLAINLSGKGGVAGEQIREGALLAIEDINAKGGVRGHPVALVIRDDRNTEEGIAAADEELIREGVVAIFGHTYSDATLTAYPLVTSRGVMLFTAYTATNKLSGKDDLFFRTSVDTVAYGKALALLLEKKNVRSVAFLMDVSNASFGEEYIGETAKHYTGSSVSVAYDPARKDQWDDIVRNILERSPRAVVLLTDVSTTGIAAQKLRSAGYRGDLIATLWAQTPDLMRVGGNAVEGMSLITYVDPHNDRPEYRALNGRMEAVFRTSVTARSVRSYEAMQIIAEALGRCRVFTAQELKEALLRAPFETVMGSVAFDRFGDVMRPVYEVKVLKGSFVNHGELL